MREMDQMTEFKKFTVRGCLVVLLFVVSGVLAKNSHLFRALVLNGSLFRELGGAIFGVAFSLGNLSLWATMFTLLTGNRPRFSLLPFLNSIASPFLLWMTVLSLKTSLFLLLIVLLWSQERAFATPFLLSSCGCLGAAAWSSWAVQKQTG